MRVLILDTETTGVNPELDSIIEYGMISYSVDHACIIESQALLVQPFDNFDGNSWVNPAEHVNRIPGELVLAEGYSPLTALSTVLEMLCIHEAVLAHNGAFDRAFIKKAIDFYRAFLEASLIEHFETIPWVDTQTDIAWPRATSSKALTSLALAHDLGVAHAHRALADCDLIARLLTRSKELGTNLEAVIRRGMRPKTRIVSTEPFERKDAVKAAGFSWDAERKVWWRFMQLEDAAALPVKWKVEEVKK